MTLVRQSDEAKEFWVHFKLVKRIKKLELKASAKTFINSYPGLLSYQGVNRRSLDL